MYHIERAGLNWGGSLSLTRVTEEVMVPQGTDEFLDAALSRGEEVAGIVNNLVNTMKGAESVGERLLAAGKLYEIANSYTLASMAYEQAMTAGDLADEVKVRTALVLLKTADPRRALVIANGVVHSSPQFIFRDISGRRHSVFAVLGDALRANCNVEGAESAYRQAMTIVPDDEHSASHLAMLLMEKPNIDEAMALVKPLVADNRFTELQSTINLLGNAPLRLPAITSIVRNSLFAAKPQV